MCDLQTIWLGWPHQKCIACKINETCKPTHPKGSHLQTSWSLTNLHVKNKTSLKKITMLDKIIIDSACNHLLTFLRNNIILILNDRIIDQKRGSRRYSTSKYWSGIPVFWWPRYWSFDVKHLLNIAREQAIFCIVECCWCRYWYRFYSKTFSSYMVNFKSDN